MVRFLIAFTVSALALSGCRSLEDSSSGPLTLAVFVSARAAGEVVLEWTGGPPGVQRWQYRCLAVWGTEYEEGPCGEWIAAPRDWGDWRNIPLKRTRTTRHRVSGLQPGVFYEFQVRPHSSDGLGEPSQPAKAIGTTAGSDGIVHTIHADRLEPGGVFRLSDSPYFTFTVPTNGSWQAGDTSNGILLRHIEVDAAMVVVPLHGRSVWRQWADVPDEVQVLFDEILASIRFNPERPNPPLVALVGGGEGEIVLEWTNTSDDVMWWQYRQRRSPNRPWEPADDWDQWTDIPGSDEHTTSYRLMRVPSIVSFDFQVRPWTHTGPGSPYDPALAVRLDEHGRDGIPRAGNAELLESGRTFRIGYRDLVLDVPPGMRIVARNRAEEWDVERGLWYSVVILDTETGSWLWLDDTTGKYIERHVTAEGYRSGVDALFGQIVASTRRVP